MRPLRSCLLALVAVALLGAQGASAAIIPVNGSYEGHDEIGRPVDFHVSGTSLTSFRLRGNVIVRNAHVGSAAFSTSENGVHIAGRWTSDTRVTGTITAGGSTAHWTINHQPVTWHPSTGTYMGDDGFGHSIHLSFSSGHARGFTSAGGLIFSAAAVSDRRFSTTVGGVHVTGHWLDEHYVEGTINYNGYHTTWSARAYAF